MRLSSAVIKELWMKVIYLEHSRVTVIPPVGLHSFHPRTFGSGICSQAGGCSAERTAPDILVWDLFQVGPCVINSMFRVPWGPEIHARARSQHNTNLIFNTVHFYCTRRCILKFCVENNHNLEKWMSYAFSISHVGELSEQNRCASGTRNIELSTHGLITRAVIGHLSASGC
jgi:hypothetical protein